MVSIVTGAKASAVAAAAHQFQKHAVRLKNPNTGLWLHLSGRGETGDIDLSWAGYRHQADALQKRDGADDWPYEVAPLHEVIDE